MSSQSRSEGSGTLFSPDPQPVYADYGLIRGHIVARREAGIDDQYDPLTDKPEVLVDLAAILDEGPAHRSRLRFVKRYGLLEGPDQEPEGWFWAHVGSVRSLLQLGYQLQEGKTAAIVEALSNDRRGGTGDVGLSFVAGLTSSGGVVSRRKRIPWSDDVASVARQVIATIITENLHGLTHLVDPNDLAVRVAVPTLRHAVYVHLATALAGPLGVCGEGQPERGCQGIYPKVWHLQMFCSLRCGNRSRKQQRRGEKAQERHADDPAESRKGKGQ